MRGLICSSPLKLVEFQCIVYLLVETKLYRDHVTKTAFDEWNSFLFIWSVASPVLLEIPAE